MAPREPNRPQLDFPQLTADLIEQLNLKGQVGLLDFLDSVQPTVIIAVREGVGFSSNPPTFQSPAVFSNSSVGPAVNTVLADTGELIEGVHDVIFGWSMSGNTAIVNVDFQHRDAANAVTLANWPHLLQGDANVVVQSLPINFAYGIALDERLRVQIIGGSMSAGARVNSWIMAQARPIP